MSTHACQRPVEDPKHDNQAESKPGMGWNSSLFTLEAFGFYIGCHAPSLH